MATFRTHCDAPKHHSKADTHQGDSEQMLRHRYLNLTRRLCSWRWAWGKHVALPVSTDHILHLAGTYRRAAVKAKSSGLDVIHEIRRQ
jgi:hypothetical protein